MRPAGGGSVLELVLRQGPRFVRDACGPVFVFYAGWKIVGFHAGIAAATALAVVAYLWERRQARSGLSPAIGLGIALVQAVAGLMSARTLWYFAPSLIVNAACGVAFVVSVAVGQPLAAAFAAKSQPLVEALKANMPALEANAALTAAALMGMNNAWYPFVEMAEDAELKTMRAELRMNAYASSGGVEKKKFEAYALSASIIGKCHFCVKSHYELLKKEGLTTQQLRDIGRIAAVINAAAQVLAAG